MAHFLVTGGAGFIGSNIVEHLVGNGDKVRVIDNFATGKRKNIEPWRGKIDLLEGSIADFAVCQRAVEGVDYVLHQGALPSVPKSVAMPRETNEANVVGTVNMLTAARDAKVKRFVFAASSSAYGDTPTLPKVESMPGMPLSPYAVQKFACEHFCRVFYQQYGLETVALRYFNIFGPRQDPTSQYGAVIPKFVSAYLRDESPVIFGDGTQSRDFTFIENAVSANLKACTAEPKCAGEVINIACGERINLLDLARVIRETIGSSKEPTHTEPRAGDVKDSLADINKAESLIGYKVQVPFAEGIARTIDWYKENQDAWA